MPQVPTRFQPLDAAATRWMAAHAALLLRLSLGVVFLWFGALKLVPGLSPAQGLATHTIGVLSAGMIPEHFIAPGLGAWECLIGLGLITGVWMRATLLLLFLQMAGTFTPLILFPHECFSRFPFVPTMEGQYIIKNLVLISAAIAIGATLHRDHIAAEPVAA